MILEDILCDVKNSLVGMGYFSDIYEYAEMTNTKTDRGTLSYPKAYIGDGNYIDVYNLEPNSGYIRKTSEVSIEEIEDNTQSCDSDWIKVTYPMRFVGGVSKELLGDNSYSDDKIAYEVLEVLGGRISNIGNTKSVFIKPTSYETDRNKVWQSEVSGMEEIINLSLVYLYVNFNIEVETKRNCLIDVCYG